MLIYRYNACPAVSRLNPCLVAWGWMPVSTDPNGEGDAIVYPNTNGRGENGEPHVQVGLRSWRLPPFSKIKEAARSLLPCLTKGRRRNGKEGHHRPSMSLPNPTS